MTFPVGCRQLRHEAQNSYFVALIGSACQGSVSKSGRIARNGSAKRVALPLKNKATR